MNQMLNNTLKNNFQNFLKEYITPLLKRYGFKKKNNNYIYSNEGIDYIINVQLSRWNDSENLSFTFNWGIEFPNQFNSWLRSKRLPILCTGYDKWWDFTKDKPFLNTEEITNIKEIIEGGIKFFNYLKNIDDILDLVDCIENKKDYKGFYANILLPQLDLFKEKLYQIRDSK